MEKRGPPKIPSRSEERAKVRCQGEQNRLGHAKGELDKVWHAESQYLKTNRNRFVIDRRRSMGTVYNSQIEGIQPHMRIRRKRRDSDPEVIDIFRRQADRRKSVKAMETALSEDAMQRLELRYREGLRRGDDGDDNDDDDTDDDFDEDEEEAYSSDAEVIHVPGLEFKESGFELAGVGPKTGKRTPDADGHRADGQAARDPQGRLKDKQSSSEEKAHSENAELGQQQQQHQQRTSQESVDGEGKLSDGGVDESAANCSLPVEDALGQLSLRVPEASRTVPRRKRSYSDGNISVSFFELQNKDLHPFNLAKAAALTALKQSGDDVGVTSENPIEGWSENGGSFPRSPRLTSGDDLSPRDLTPLARDETYVIDTDVTESDHSGQRRKLRDVSFELPSLTSSSTTVTRGRDLTSSSKPGCVTTSPRMHRRQAYDGPPAVTEIKFSPSLVRKLADSDRNRSPRRSLDGVDVTAPRSQSLVTRRRYDVTTDAASSSKAAPDQSDSPRPNRRGTKASSDKPKPIYQQTTDPKHHNHHHHNNNSVTSSSGANANGKAGGGGGGLASKPRPLRRSRSEALGLSELSVSRDRGLGPPPFTQPRLSRRGSESVEALRGGEEVSRRPPKSWNSLLYGLALDREEREDIARYKRNELMTSLRKRQMEVDSDVRRRIQTFLQRYDDC